MNRNLVLAAMFATATGVACAGDSSSNDFSALDEDKDGSITQEEALDMPDLSSSFRGLDEDQNGRLTEAEFSKFEVNEDYSPDARPEQGIEDDTEAPGTLPVPDDGVMDPTTGDADHGSDTDSYQ